MLKILLIILVVFACLFLLSLIVYFFNLDMKLAAAMIPVMNKIYDRGKAKRDRKASGEAAVRKTAGKSDGNGTDKNSKAEVL